jgi:zinc/manganese transport system permease protein
MAQDNLTATVFLLVLALAVSITIQVVGVLLILTLVITPAGTAQRLTLHPVRMLVYSVLIALGATLGGIACAIYTSLPPSFFVSTFSLGAYLLGRWLNPIGRTAARPQTAVDVPRLERYGPPPA